MAETDELPVLEHGRYRLWQTPDGGWLLGRAAFTCDRCQSCGCGEKQDHVVIPGMLVRMAESLQNGGGSRLSPVGMFRRLMGHGRDTGTEPGDSEEAAESDDHTGADLAGVAATGLADQEGGSGAGDGGAGDPDTV